MKTDAPNKTASLKHSMQTHCQRESLISKKSIVETENVVEYSAL